MDDRETQELLQLLELDPYAGEGGRLVALRVQNLQNRPSADSDVSWAYAQSHARNLCVFAQQALLYWSPERVEREALRRAADDPAPSVIAREVQLFTLRYQKFVEVLAETLPYVTLEKQTANVYIRQMQFYLASFENVLLALERRAAAAEARATDYRLRYDLGQVRAAVENSRIASAVVDAIRDAMTTTEEAHLSRIDQALTEKLGPLLEEQQRTQRDVDFIATWVGQETVKKLLPAEKVRAKLEALATAAGVQTLKALLLALAGRL